MNENETETEKTPEMIDGTVCSECYLIFAEKDGAKIGIRPLVSLDYSQSYIGFRIRAVMSEQDADFTDGETTLQAFAGFDFQKSNSTRCSLVGGLYVNRGKYQMDEILGYMQTNRVVAKVISTLKEHLEGHPLLDEDTLYAFLMDRYDTLINEQGTASQDDAPMPTLEATVVHMSDYKAQQALNDALNKTDESEETEAEVSTE